MTPPVLPRRGFLRGLITLPLIGGGVTLIGNPTAAAEPVTADLLMAYDEWLFHERRLLRIEQYGMEAVRREPDFVPCNTGAGGFHLPDDGGRQSRSPPPAPLSS